MLPYLFTNLDFAGLFRFVSPSFFRVISPAALFRIAPRLRRNYGDLDAWNELRGRLEHAIRDAAFPPAKNPGEHALRLFFFQILSFDTWVLDFRAEAFAAAAKTGSGWNPKPLFYEVQPPFARSVRELYRGFYLDDEGLFDRALADLGLLPAKDCLRRHFGVGDQTRVEFRIARFQNTFADVFQVCEREGIQLQTEFFVLGLMLLTLYQNLEAVGEPQDARGCFREALAKAPNP
jgi:hypothetical protein